MKTTRLLSALLALSLAGFSACKKDDIDKNNTNDPDLKAVAVTITSGSSLLTRTVMDGDRENGFETLWETGNSIGVFTSGTPANHNRQFSIQEGGISSEGIATFKGTFAEGTTGNIMVYGYYPWSASAGIDPTAVALSVPATQAMTRDSHDHTADHMVAVGQTAHVEGATLGMDDFRFRYLVSFTHFSTVISTDKPHGTPIYGQDKVTKVTFETAGGIPISGDFSVNLTDGTASYPAQAAEGGHRIEVAVPDNTTVEGLSVWFVTLPFALTADDEMKVTIHTEMYTIEKKLTGRALTFAAGAVRTMDLKIDSDCEITLITGVPQAPSQAYITGAATEFPSGKAMREVSPGVFEIYTSLKEGQFGFTDSETGAVKYTNASGSLVEGSRTLTAEPGEYYIKLDFESGTVAVEKLTNMRYHHPSQGTTVPMEYVGNGIWKVEGVRPTTPSAGDERYRFNVNQGGKDIIWGYQHGDSPSRPGELSGTYYDIYPRVKTGDSWAYTFKYHSSLLERLVDITIDMSAEAASYNHTVNVRPFTITPGVPSSPQDGLNLDLNDGNTSLEFSWSAGSSTDGIAPTYEVVFYADASATAELKRMKSASNGTAANLTVPYSEINMIAANAGVAMGSNGEIYWTVFTQRAGQELAPESGRSKINVTRIQGIENIPSQIYITGPATEFGSGYRVFRKNDMVFDIVTRLTPGSYAFSSTNDGSGVKYGINDGKLYEGSESITDTRDGIYRITLDFRSSMIQYELITDMVHFMEAAGTTNPMTYAGDGVWTLNGFDVVFHDMGGWFDERFHYRLRIDGVQYKWGSKDSGGNHLNNPEDYEVYQEISQAASGNWQWDYGWKFKSEHRDRRVNIRLTTWPDDGRTQYTQTVTLAE